MNSDDETVVVGIGASAGGLEALLELLGAMPEAPGLAFVVIQHLDPTRASLTADILQARTRMKVAEVEDGPRVVPNHVYVIPPDRYLGISGNKLHLHSPAQPRGRRAAVDFFLRELAIAKGHRAVAVILSGSGSDGSLGIKAIKARGGLVIAQRPESAAHDGMPRSALETGAVDRVLDVVSIPDELIRYAGTDYVRRPEMAPPPSSPEEAGDGDAALRSILELLREQSRHDFASYKENTLHRRIRRRMCIHHIDDMGAYLAYLRTHADELKRLAGDLLISVTDFFRDPEAWEELRTAVIDPLVGRKGPDETIRAWVAGCATGEEPYTLVILLMEALRAAGKSCPLQVFASDLDETALEFARKGRYPSSVAVDLSPERLRSYLVPVKGEDAYQVNESLREAIVFAEQNLIADPPFSRMDLVCCRNVLIYLKPKIQERLISLFHFALADGGYLMLGNSETIGRHEGMFEVVSKRWRIYRRVGPTRHDRVEIPLFGSTFMKALPSRNASSDSRSGLELNALAQQHLLQVIAPRALLVTRNWQILHISGAVDEYLMHAPGVPSANLLELARPGLRARLRGAVHKAFTEQRMVKTRTLLRRGGKQAQLRLTVKPINDPANERVLALVLFEESAPAGLPDTGPGETKSARSPGQSAPDSELDEPAIIRQLESELSHARDELQSTVEQLETSNEEYKAANEEVMSINEELQSTNEELETSKEELQSLNEELTTVNSQLSVKIDELETKHSDLENLVAATDVATLCLDRDLLIRWFTPALLRVFRVTEADKGRPFTDFAHDFAENDLPAVARRVLKKLVPIEDEVTCAGGQAFLRRVQPYRTDEERIGGVVITFVDISHRKRSEVALAELNERLSVDLQQMQTIHEISTQLLVEGDIDALLDGILVASCSLLRTDMGTLQLFDEERGVLLLNAQRGFDAAFVEHFREVEADSPCICGMALKRRARVVVPDVKADGAIADGDTRAMLDAAGVRAVQATPLLSRTGAIVGVISTHWQGVHEPSERELKMLDLLARQATELVERTRGEAALRESEARLRRHAEKLLEQERRKDMFLATLGHELRNPLAALHAGLQLEGSEESERAVSNTRLNQHVEQLTAIVNDLLEVTRISHGKLILRTEPADLAELANGALADVRADFDQKGVRLASKLAKDVLVEADPIRVGQILINLLSNACKFTPRGGLVTVEVLAEPRAGVARITDTGCGMTAEMLATAFEPFAQAVVGGEGCGLGLALAHGLAQLHGGSLEARSAGTDRGSQFVLRLPPAVARTSSDERVVPAWHLQGMRILVVDDHRDTSFLYGRLLERRGALVEIAYCGKEALDKEASFLPSVVMLDLSLPDMSGFEVAQKIRERGRPIRLIAVTGFGDDLTARRVAECGFDKLMLKPVELEDLRRVLVDELAADAT